MKDKKTTPSVKSSKSTPTAKQKSVKNDMPSSSSMKMKESYGSKPPKMGPKTKKALGTALLAAPVAVIGAMKMISDRQKKKDSLKWRDSGLGSYNKKK